MKSIVMLRPSIVYVEECRRRGYEPIAIIPPDANLNIDRFRRIAGDIKIIEMKSEGDYPDILRKMKKLGPECVVCGAEGGQYIADRLARDLGLTGNDPETTDLRSTKDGMQRALKEAGIRYIRTAVVESKKDVEDFWKREKISKAMVKYARGAFSFGNKICHSLEEATDYVGIMLKGRNVFGVKDRVLIQEFIEGTEYIVDTVSCQGKHMVTDLWRYRKVITPDGSVPYDESVIIAHPEPGIPELVQYAFKVLDATGFEYGPCHGEYMIDDEGPVLIETNPRPMGTMLTSEYLDEITDGHIADISLDSYISPELFFARSSQPYRPKKHSMFKCLIMPKDCDISFAMLRTVLEHMESFRYTANDISAVKAHVERTIDLENTPAIIKFTNADYRRMREDADLLFDLETKYFGLLEHGEDRVKPAKMKTDIPAFSGPFVQNRKTLVVTDKGEYVTRNGRKIKDVKDAEGFGAAVYADASACKVRERLESIMVAAERLREDGVIVVAPEVYENLPCGRAAVELALKVAGCDLEVRTGNDVPVVARRIR